jgi:uncharacterized protein (TIGR03000 family)
MRRFPLATAALLLAAVPAFAQIPTQVPVMPFTPYVPPMRCIGRVGRDYLKCVIPDRRVLAAAAFYSTGFDTLYYSYYGPRPVMNLRVPAEEPAPEPQPIADPTRAVVTLEVAETAEVWVEDQKLTQPGASRRFVSPELTPGESYRYTVRVRWSEQGKPRERKLQIPVQAGERQLVAVFR